MVWGIVRLNKTHERTAFTCGVVSLDEFLHRLVGQYEKRNLGRTYVLVRDAEPRVFGYFTLAAGSVSVADLPEKDAKKLPKHPVPVALLARLAIDVTVRGQGLGAELLAEALATVAEMSERLGVHAVCVDAIDESAARFYEKHGLIPLRDQPSRLFLPVGSIPEGTDQK